MANHKVQGLGDHSLGDIVLDGKKLDARIEKAVTQASLERTIDGLSTFTLTVDDPERLLPRGGYYQRKADLLLDDLWFKLRQTSVDGDMATLTFVDREGAILLDFTKKSHRARSQTTLAEFLRSRVLAAAPHIQFVCPDLSEKKPIADLSKAEHQKIKDARRGRGIADSAKLTIKGAPITAGQRANLQIALDVAETIGSGEKAALAMLCAGIGESGWKDIMNGNQIPVATYLANPTGGTSGYGGVLQGQVTEHSDNWFAKMDSATRTREQAKSFLEGGRGYQGGGGIALAKQGVAIGDIGGKVEGGGITYGQWLPEAKKIYDAYGGVGANPDTSGGETRAYVKQYLYSQGPPSGPKGESVWECGQRYAALVQRRWFIVAGVVFYIDDWDLIRSRPRMTITDSTRGIDSIAYELTDSPKKPDALTITCRAGRWAAPPGTVIVVDPEYDAEVAGAWIVSDITRDDLLSDATVITATKPLEEKPEPASTVVTQTVTTKLGSTLDGGVNAGPTTGLSSVGGYVYPFARAHGLVVGRIDMGQDFSMGVGSPIVAIGKSHVEGIYPNWFRGQPIMVFKLLDGSKRGSYWYLAEQITPRVGAGDTVEAGDTVALYASSGTAIEIGWASGRGEETLAQATTGYSEGEQTVAGKSFAAFLTHIKNGARGPQGLPG